MGFERLYDIEILTLEEYRLRMKAYQLRRVDKEYEMHLQAWLNHAVTATKKQGEKYVPVFKEFKDFFDYEKRIKEIEGKRTLQLSPRQRKLAEVAARVNEGR